MTYARLRGVTAAVVVAGRCIVRRLAGVVVADLVDEQHRRGPGWTMPRRDAAA